MPAISSETVINAQAPGEAMEALPAPPGLTKVQAAVMALDAYPVGPVDAVRLQRVADASGSSRASRRSILVRC